jgi:hypothetical protein
VHVTFLARNRPLIKLKNTVESEHPKSSVAWNSLINKTYLLFKNIKKTIFYGGLIIAMALLMPLASHSQSSKTNFSGNWTVNQSKNQMPGGEKMGDSYFTVSQNEKEMIVTNHGIQGSIRYNLDGKESVNSTPQGDNKSVATWSADGKTLNISTKQKTSTADRKLTESWTLTSPSNLTIVVTVGEKKGTLFFERK